MTITVELRLETGGSVSGPVLDFAPDGLVILFNQRPFALAWEEVEVGSAYRAKRDWLQFVRGGADQLSAQDHFDLGLFALERDRIGTAALEFKKAKSLEPQFTQAVKRSLTRYRQNKQSITQRRRQMLNAPAPAPPGTIDPKAATLAEEVAGLLPPRQGAEPTLVKQLSPKVRDKVMAVYRRFGRAVEDTMGKHVGLIETTHFLIWTDWGKANRAYLADLAERMYHALCVQFDVDPGDHVFLAKCPMFCWQSTGKLREFARRFDGYDAKNTTGYTRSVQRTGHVHVVLVRLGTGKLSERRFAETLVHEGTHAFLHRLYTTRLLPQWVNEGVAEMMAQRVVGDRCINSIKARLLSRQFAQHDWPIVDFLASTGPIDISEYPLAHSVIAYLQQRDAASFTAFIRGLKGGQSTATALAENFDDLTFSDLESQWKDSVRAADRADNPATNTENQLRQVEPR